MDLLKSMILISILFAPIIAKLYKCYECNGDNDSCGPDEIKRKGTFCYSVFSCYEREIKIDGKVTNITRGCATSYADRGTGSCEENYCNVKQKENGGQEVKCYECNGMDKDCTSKDNLDKKKFCTGSTCYYKPTYNQDNEMIDLERGCFVIPEETGCPVFPLPKREICYCNHDFCNDNSPNFTDSPNTGSSTKFTRIIYALVVTTVLLYN